MGRTHTLDVAAIAATMIACSAILSVAGDLDPPPGAVAPTMKPLEDVEPRIPVGQATTPGDANSIFRITQSGSYYLTGNLTGEPGKHAVEIAADDVSLDLMGHTLRGVPGSLDGISRDASALDNISILNGTVRDWGDDGIDLGTGSNHLVASVRAIANAEFGILVDQNAIVSFCTASSNGSVGIICSDDNSLIRHCASSLNGGVGFRMVANGVISRSTAFDNAQAGFSIGFSVVLESCSSRRNDAEGIVAGSECSITRCVITDNAGDCIDVLSRCTIANNVMDGAGIGLHVRGDGNRIEANQIMGGIHYDIDGVENLVIRNMYHDTVGSSTVVGNAIGPTIAGADVATTSHAHANFDP